MFSNVQILRDPFREKFQAVVHATLRYAMAENNIHEENEADLLYRLFPFEMHLSMLYYTDHDALRPIVCSQATDSW